MFQDLPQNGPRDRRGRMMLVAATWSLHHSRRLQGEILCDSTGRLYEKTGSFVAPIHHLVPGPCGEVLDVAPPSAAKELVDERPREIPASIPGWRALSGVRSRLVPFGEFKNVLSAQLAQPRRLRDSHLLSCRLHLYEVGRPVRLSTLAEEIPDCSAAQLLVVSPALAARLDVADLLPRRRQPPPGGREPGVAAAGDIVVRLEVLDDPTAPPAGEAAPAPRAKSIPERFMVPWQFAIGRDEAIYDMNLTATQSPLVSLVTRIWTSASRRRELRKWQALLNGRGADDQLWAVRPPADRLTNPVVREWARRALEAAGYDPSTMLFEWDVYWTRRRG